MWILLLSLARADCPPDPALALRSTLHLGRSGPEPVSRREVRVFLREAVSPTFAGFSVLRADGWWERSREHTVVLVVLHGRPALPQVLDIAEAWRGRFVQQAVLVETIAVDGRWVTAPCR